MESDPDQEQESSGSTFWSLAGLALTSPTPQRAPRPAPASLPTPPPTPPRNPTPVAMSTQASTTSSTTPTPRIGGFEIDGNAILYFSGGGSLRANRISEPNALGAYRPSTDLRSRMRIEEACVRPMEETMRIDEGASTVTFTQWMNEVQRHFTDNGLDSVAYVLKPKKANSQLPDINDLTLVEQECNEYNLFEEWGVLSKDDMIEWETALATSRTKMDKVNQSYSRRYLRSSVGKVLRERIDRELPIGVSGARLLFFIIRKLQGVSAVSGRQLVEELQKIKLSAVPGYHVQECAQKVHNVCTKIVGLGATHTPADLPMLVCQCFDTTNIQAFDLEVTKIESDLDDDPTSHTWTSILDQLTSKFDKLHLSKRWPPLNTDKPTVVTGFAVQLEEVKKGLRDVKSVLQNGSKGKADVSGTSTRDLSDVECNYCHKKGHYKSSCPSLANKSTPGTSDSSSNKPAAKTKHWTRTGPSDNEPHTKSVTVEGKNVTFKWCGTCKRWRSGAKGHLTAEHKKKNAAPATTIAGHALQASSDGINFGLFAAETHLEFDHPNPIPGGFLETFYKFHPPPDSASDPGSNDGDSFADVFAWDLDDDDDGPPWNLVREGEGTPFHKAVQKDKLRRHPKGFAGQW